MRDITRFQAKWKGTLTRRRHQVIVTAGVPEAEGRETIRRITIIMG